MGFEEGILLNWTPLIMTDRCQKLMFVMKGLSNCETVVVIKSSILLNLEERFKTSAVLSN